MPSMADQPVWKEKRQLQAYRDELVRTLGQQRRDHRDHPVALSRKTVMVLVEVLDQAIFTEQQAENRRRQP